MKNIAKGTANPGVDFFCFLECFNYISAIQLKFNFVRFGLVWLLIVEDTIKLLASLSARVTPFMSPNKD